MPIPIQCPKCKTKLRAPDAAAGKRVRCKQCQTAIIVPAIEDDTDQDLAFTSAPAKSTKRPSVKRAADEDDDEEDDDDEPAGVPLLVKLLVVVVFLAILGGGGWLGYTRFGSKTLNPVVAQNDKNPPVPVKPASKPPVKEEGSSPPQVEPKPKQQEPPSPTEPTKVEPKKENPPVQNDPAKKIDPKAIDVANNFPDDPNAKKASAGAPTKTPDGAMTFTIDPKNNIRFLGLSADGKTLYTSAWGGDLIYWDLETLKERDRITLPDVGKLKKQGLRAALSPDRRLLAFVYWDLLQILDLETKKIDILANPNPAATLYSLPQFSADGALIVTKYIYNWALWDVKERKFIKELIANTISLNEGTHGLAPEGDQFMTINSEFGFRLAPLANPKDDTEYKISEEKRSYRMPRFSPSGKLLVLEARAGENGALQVIDWASKKPVTAPIELRLLTKNKFSESIANLAFSPDESTMVACIGERIGIQQIDIAKGTVLGAVTYEPISAAYYGPSFAQWTPNGQKLIVGYANLVKVWDVKDIPWK